MENRSIRYAGVIMLFCLMVHLYLINVCLGDDKKRTPFKDMCIKEIGACLWMFLTTPHPIVNTIGRAYVFSRVNKYALLLTIMNSREFDLNLVFVYVSS